jgi:ribosome-associated heat shock protein Hsp15
MNGASLRLDKWLWFARFFKSRSLAARQCQAGRVRINSARVLKPSAPVRVGDVLTFSQARMVRVVRICALGARRGPAVEARALYEDLSPPGASAAPAASRIAARPRGAGRPTKAQRRALEALRGDGH